MVESDFEFDLRLVGSFYQELLAVPGSGILPHVNTVERKLLRSRGLVGHVKRGSGFVWVLTPYTKLLMSRLHHD